MSTVALAGGTSAPPAGCSTEIPPGDAVFSEMRHDMGGSPTHIVTAGYTSGVQDMVVHANRYTGASTIITHICIYTEIPDPFQAGSQTMTLFIADTDDTTFGDFRPGPYAWQDGADIKGGWQLVEVDPPFAATSVTWIGAEFPSASAFHAHMGTGNAMDTLSDGVTPTPNQSFVGIVNLIGGQSVWTDYEDILEEGFLGHRAIIRGLEIGVADCSAAGIVVNAAPGLETGEDGTNAAFEVALVGPPPQENILVLLDSSDSSEGVPDPSVLVFLAGQYTQPQIVTVEGQDDAATDGDIDYAITMFSSSLDACYHQLAGESVQLVNLDDDTVVVTPCPTDLNGDGSTNAADLALVLGSWGPCSSLGTAGRGGIAGADSICAADLNFDGIVNAADLALVLGAWGDCPEPPIACAFPSSRDWLQSDGTELPHIAASYDAVDRTVHLLGELTFEELFTSPLDAVIDHMQSRLATMPMCVTDAVGDPAAIDGALENIRAAGGPIPLQDIATSSPADLGEVKLAIDQLRLLGVAMPPAATTSLDALQHLVQLEGVLSSGAHSARYGDLFFTAVDEFDDEAAAIVQAAIDAGDVLRFEAVNVDGLTIYAGVNDGCCKAGGCPASDALDVCLPSNGQCFKPGSSDDCGSCRLGDKKCP